MFQAELLFGHSVSSVADAERAARTFLDCGCRNVVLTMGALGVVFASATDKKTHHFPAKQVQVLDSTVRLKYLCTLLMLRQHLIFTYCTSNRRALVTASWVHSLTSSLSILNCRSLASYRTASTSLQSAFSNTALRRATQERATYRPA